MERPIPLLAAAMLLCVSATASAQWFDYTDTQTGEICGVVNTCCNNAFIVLGGTGQLVSIDGVDTVLEDSFVDEAGNVFFEGEQRGALTFATDADGNRGLWWVTLLSSNAVTLDEFTFAVSDSGMRPSEIGGSRCSPLGLVDLADNGNSNANDNGSDMGGQLLGALCGGGVVMAMVPIVVMLMGLRLVSRTRRVRQD